MSSDLFLFLPLLCAVCGFVNRKWMTLLLSRGHKCLPACSHWLPLILKSHAVRSTWFLKCLVGPVSVYWCSSLYKISNPRLWNSCIVKVTLYTQLLAYKSKDIYLYIAFKYQFNHWIFIVGIMVCPIHLLLVKFSFFSLSLNLLGFFFINAISSICEKSEQKSDVCCILALTL